MTPTKQSQCNHINQETYSHTGYKKTKCKDCGEVLKEFNKNKQSHTKTPWHLDLGGNCIHINDRESTESCGKRVI